MTSHKGLTKIEVLIIGVVILLLALILLPILSRSRSMAKRQTCQNNLHTIANYFHLYNCDYKCQNPIIWSDAVRSDAQFGMGLYNAPGATTYTRWVDPDFRQFGKRILPALEKWNQEPTAGGCLYLLIVYEDAQPKEFLCPADPLAVESNLALAVSTCQNNGWLVPEGWNDLNDFHSMANLSYAYNDPWAAPLDDSATSALVLLADRNPAYATVIGSITPQAGAAPDGSSRAGNSPNHRSTGQNVLFADHHAQWCPTPLVGIQEDNIYTHWDIPDRDKADKHIGRWDRGHAQDLMDSYLGN
ncbi:MAG: hypothetical protein JW709_03325 [Sedimentisphaerales bacterium]|nr:hypothetical protein [Sedimentisphaerales bacterium]